MNIIDLHTWKRRSEYEFFRTFSSPHGGITSRVDVTGFYAKAKTRDLSLFRAVLFAIMKTANSIPEFRTRFSGDSVYEHEVVHPSFTVPIADDRFAFCEAAYSPDWEKFDSECKKQTDRAMEQLGLGDEATKGTDHWIFLSCMPWLDFTASQHPVASPDDCIPRISWGKITEESGRWRMPVNLQAHHALIDGVHMSQFYKGLEAALYNF